MTRHLLGLVLLAAPTATALADEPKPALVVRGNVVPAARATLSAAAPGILSRIFVRDGQRVKKGEPLAALDDADARLAALVAEAKVVLAKERLAAAERGWDAERDLLALQRERAKMHLDRLRKLRDIAAEAELRDAEADVKKADAVMAAHERRILEAEERVAKAGLEVARRAIDAAALRVPFDGAVVRVLASVGEYVKAGDPVAEVIDPSRLFAEVEVKEPDLAKVAVGQKCRVLLNVGDETVAGTVTEIGLVINPRSGTCPVKVAFDPKATVARVGGIVTVSFLNAEK